MISDLQIYAGDGDGFSPYPHPLTGEIILPSLQYPAQQKAAPRSGGSSRVIDGAVADEIARSLSQAGDRSETDVLGIAAVLCAVKVISEDMAQLPLHLYEEADGKTKKATKHPLYRLLYTAPNDWMTSFEFREFLFVHAVLGGNAYAYINRPGGPDSEIKELLPLRSCRPVQDADWDVVYELRDATGVIARVPRTDILHLRGLSLDGLEGLNCVSQARRVFGLAEALEDAQQKLYTKGQRLSGVLSTDQKLSPEQVARIKADWSEQFGPNGKGGIALLDAGFKFTAMTMSNADAQTVEQMEFAIEQVARVFRIFPVLLMQKSANSAYASVEQFFSAHVRNTLMPWATRLEQVIARDLLRGEPGLYAKHQLNAFMRGTANDRSSYYGKALGGGANPGFMTINEVRALEELDPLKGGDDIYVPLNLKKLGDPDPAAQPAKTPPQTPTPAKEAAA